MTTSLHHLEKELWEAADQLRANSKLTAAEYSMPVLGLIFLRHADNRFKVYLPEITADIPPRVPAAQREELIRLGFQGKAAIYLPELARFETLAALPQGAKVGQAIDDAMQHIEDEVDILKGALPRGYTAFEPDLLAELIKIFNRESLRRATGDVFGRIYEYFLNKFAQSGAQEGGEFFTPPSLVRMAEYADSLKQATEFLGDLGYDVGDLIAAQGFDKQSLILRAVDLLCETDERRKTYQVIVEDVQARHRGLFPHPGLFAHDADESAVSAIYNKLQDARTTPDVSALLQSFYEVVDTALTTDGGGTRLVAKQPVKQYDLSNIDFTRLRAEFEKSPFKNVVTLNLKEKIEERLAMMLARNPTRVDLYERYQEIVKEYNKDKDAAEIQKVMDDLFAFNDKLNEEEKRYLREGLENDDQLAVFDLLQKESLTKGDRDRIKQVAMELLDKLMADKLQIDHWREKATAQAQIKAEIIKHLYSALPPGSYEPDEIAFKANLVFTHLYTSNIGWGVRVYH